MCGETPMVRPAICNDDPLGDLHGAPVEWSRNHRAEPFPTVRGREEIEDVNQLCLELDQQDSLGPLVPRHDVDDPAFAEMTERHLRPNFPVGAHEPCGHNFRHCGVSR